MNKSYHHLLKQAYNSFNKRDIDAVLLLMDEHVEWPNGWEGGYVYGHDEVRHYWTRQWKEINPTVTPVSFTERENGQVEILVHQLVKDLQGNVLLDGRVKHIYTLENGKIKRMEIEKQ